eukprot:TRINITY_DN97448_c0_g1_i1.p1 TRINITY_DN97448_c0_g1~~TRINITY_DN97448_c0_g1_i1.p1  ORF type:complete len:164 (-),score=15.55 TRINITY_DN97448_c0_g1_i1:130-621(-)
MGANGSIGIPSLSATCCQAKGGPGCKIINQEPCCNQDPNAKKQMQMSTLEGLESTKVNPWHKVISGAEDGHFHIVPPCRPDPNPTSGYLLEPGSVVADSPMTLWLEDELEEQVQSNFTDARPTAHRGDSRSLAGDVNAQSVFGRTGTATMLSQGDHQTGAHEL